MIAITKYKKNVDIFFVFNVTFFSIVGKRILVLNGGYRGNEATLESISEKTFSATIVIETVSVFTQRQISNCFYDVLYISFSFDWSLFCFRVWVFCLSPLLFGNL